MLADADGHCGVQAYAACQSGIGIDTRCESNGYRRLTGLQLEASGGIAQRCELTRGLKVIIYAIGGREMWVPPVRRTRTCGHAAPILKGNDSWVTGFTTRI